MKYRLLLCGALISVANPLNAALTTAGDIAFVGSAARISNTMAGDDRFSWVTFVDINVGDVIYFTDDEPGTFVDSEGAIQWTATAALSPGTVVEVDWDSGDNSGTASSGTISNPAGIGDSFSINTSDDSLAAYLGTNANTPTTFLTALHYSSSGDSDFFDFNHASVGLTDGTNAIDFDGTSLAGNEVFEYTGITMFASIDEARTAINNPANWAGANGSGAAAALFPFDVSPGSGAITIVPEPSTSLSAILALGLCTLRRRIR